MKAKPLNYPFTTKYQKYQEQKNLQIFERVNLPYLPINQQDEANQFNPNKFMYTKMKEQPLKEQDFTSQERFSTQIQQQKINRLGQRLRIENYENYRIPLKMPLNLFQQEILNFQNSESDNYKCQKSVTISYSKCDNHKINIPNNNTNLRSLSIAGISNRFAQQNKTNNLLKKRKSNRRTSFKIKIVALVVRAVIKISKKYIQVFFKRNQAIQHLNKLKSLHTSIIARLPFRQIKVKSQEFVNQLFQKIINLLQSYKYIKENAEILNQQKNLVIDFQKQRLCLFIKLLFQDLELITRKDLIPPFILHTLSLCLFSRKNIETSQFVVNRTQFYSKTVHHLTSEQRVLIAMEYLIFNIIIPNLLEIPNNLDKTNQDQQIIIQFYFTAISMLLSLFFTNHFKQLPKIKQSNVKPVQLKIEIPNDDKDEPMKSQLVVSHVLESNEEMIIKGPINSYLMYEIFNEKFNWKQQMIKIFSAIVFNIEVVIDIQNFY